jgi:hypothetical protein
MEVGNSDQWEEEADGTQSGPAGTVNRKTVLCRTAIVFLSQKRNRIVRNVGPFQAHSIVFRHIASQEGGKRNLNMFPIC